LLEVFARGGEAARADVFLCRLPERARAAQCSFALRPSTSARPRRRRRSGRPGA
jgi:hypothetical protein